MPALPSSLAAKQQEKHLQKANVKNGGVFGADAAASVFPGKKVSKHSEKQTEQIQNWLGQIGAPWSADSPLI